MALRCGGRFIVDFVEHTPTCERCAEAAVAEGKVQCTVCGLAMQEGNLDRHMRLHTGERPFRCAICLAAFATKRNLVVHLRLHYNKRPFACSDCGRTFRQEANLTYHHRCVHSSERPYACPDCAQTFKLDCILMRHKRRAHGYHYACRRCPTEFDTRDALVAHYVQHREAFRRGPADI